jgi:hypothetical protein
MDTVLVSRKERLEHLKKEQNGENEATGCAIIQKQQIAWFSMEGQLFVYITGAVEMRRQKVPSKCPY